MYDVILFTEGGDPLFQVARAVGAYKIASALRNEGYSVFVLNNFTHFIRKGNINQVLDKLIGENTLWAGFSSSLYMRKAKDVVRKKHSRDTIRKNILWTWPIEDEAIKDLTDYVRSKGVKTVYGGVMDTKRAEDVKDCIDYYIVGMAEVPAIDLTRDLRENKEVNYNKELGTTPHIIDYDTKGDLFDFRNSEINYIPEDFWGPEDAMGIEFGRGCIFRCKFCAYPLIGKKKGDKSFLRCKERIKEELLLNYELYGTTKYVIIDDTFNEQTEKLEIVAEAIEETGIKDLQFSAFIRIDLVAAFPEQIDLLRRINVCAWFLGVESLNLEAAKAIGKGCTREKIFDTIEQSKIAFDYKLSVFGSFIIGLPKDTKQTIQHWTQILFQRKDLFDSFSFSPLELGTASVLSQNAEFYGYDVNNEDNTWKNKDWDSDQAISLASELQNRVLVDYKVSSFMLMFYQALGFTFDELRNKTYDSLYDDEIIQYSRDYMEKTYYSKVESFLGLR
jgi:hypothetical protein